MDEPVLTSADSALRAELRRGLRAGDLERVRRSVYAGTSALSALSARQRHLVDVRAELELRPGWLAARRSGALVHDLPMIGPTPPTRPQLLLPAGPSSTRPVDRHHRIAVVPPEQRTVVDGIPVATLARTAVDIARQESFRNAVCVVDGVLGRGVEPAELDEVLCGMHRWPGVAAARRAVRFRNGLAENPLESLSRVAVHDARLPAPELQVEVWLGGTFLARTDALWRQVNTIGEADGLAKFGDDEADREQSFKDLRDRQARLEDVGFVVPRWGWDDVFRPQPSFADRLRRAFARGEQQRLDPRVRFVTTTVADRLRRDARRTA